MSLDDLEVSECACCEVPCGSPECLEPKTANQTPQETATLPKLVNQDLDMLYTIIERTVQKAENGDLIRIEVTKSEKGLENWSVNLYKRKKAA